MTPESRILESIHSARSQSAWSPMPEHLLFLQMETDKIQTPTTPGTSGNMCEDCGMKFKTEAMLTYHRIGFCVGNPAEEYPPSPLGLTGEETTMLEEGKSYDKTLPREGTPVVKTLPREGTPAEVSKQENTQFQSKLEWCMGADGAVPPAAVKVGYDDHDQTHTYVCLVQIGEEVIPGTVLPSRKHATVALNGEQFTAREYSVLTDLNGQLSWKRCDVVGGIPRGAVKGGYDYKNLQYFIARSKSPDGTFCCGQYIPHKQQCYFAYNGTEFTTKDFEFLCKKYSGKKFVKLGSRWGHEEKHKNTGKNIINSRPEHSSKQQHKTKDLTELSKVGTGFSKDFNKMNTEKSKTERDADHVNKSTPMSTTGMNQEKNKTSTDSSKTGPLKERTKSGIGITPKDKIKTTNNPRELTKSGTEVVSKDKNEESNARTKTSVRELTKGGTEVMSKDKNEESNARTKTGVRELTEGGTEVVSKDKNEESNARTKTGVRELTKGGTEVVSKDKNEDSNTRKNSNVRELTKSGNEVVSNHKNKVSDTRIKSGVRENTKNLQF